MRTDRLYAKSKRRRQVYLKKAGLLATAIVFALCLSILGSRELASAHGSRQESPAMYRYYKSIQVNAGDTLWDIALEYMDDTDSITDYIEELMEINQLESSEIYEGGYLTVVYSDPEFH